jgi:hypothetical protein
VLTSSNFTEWLDLAKTVLISRGLWEYATGEITEGPGSKDKQEFRREDAKAVAFLKLAAGREQRAHLLRLTSSRDALEKLKSVHQVSQLERVQALPSEFHTFKVKDSIDLGASKLTQLQLEIASVDHDEKPSDTIKKTVLLGPRGRSTYQVGDRRAPGHNVRPRSDCLRVDAAQRGLFGREDGCCAKMEHRSGLCRRASSQSRKRRLV